MHAVLLTGIGGPEMLSYCTNVPVPRPGADEMLICVGAAGVNNTDINTRIGWYDQSVQTSTKAAAAAATATASTATTATTATAHAMGEAKKGTWKGGGFEHSYPRIQGADIAGRVVAVGSHVDERLWMGQRVLVDPCPAANDDVGVVNGDGDGDDPTSIAYLGSERDGGFAQFCVVPARSVHLIDPDLDDCLTDAELATFPCSYSTAENLLTRSNCTAQDIVLVTGASGGVGSAVVQLAAQVRGATVYAVVSSSSSDTSSSSSKAEIMRELGAAKVLDRNVDLVEALGRESVTLVVDVVGGPAWPQLLDVLKRNVGRLAVSGAIAGSMVNLDLRTLYLKDLTLYGCTALGNGVFAHLVALINRRQVKPLLAQTFPLADIHQAQEVFLQKQHVGKLVLLPPPPLS